MGKTSLLLRFADESYETNYISTVGVDFRFRTVTVDNQLVKLQIWDTAGQERFRTITAAYYRGANGVILVYDITNHESFVHVKDWLFEVHKSAGETVTKLVVGNKCDLTHLRQVSESEANEYAQSVNSSFIETSAKSGIHVDKSFIIIAKQLAAKSANSDGSKQPPSIGVIKKDNCECCTIL